MPATRHIIATDSMPHPNEKKAANKKNQYILVNEVYNHLDHCVFFFRNFICGEFDVAAGHSASLDVFSFYHRQCSRLVDYIKRRLFPTTLKNVFDVDSTMIAS